MLIGTKRVVSDQLVWVREICVTNLLWQTPTSITDGVLSFGSWGDQLTVYMVWATEFAVVKALDVTIHCREVLLRVRELRAAGYVLEFRRI